jgi:hypothetical protein
MRSFKAGLAASHDFRYNERGSKLWNNHSAVLNATAYCNFATEHAQRGIDNVDPNEVQIATIEWFFLCEEGG